MKKIIATLLAFCIIISCFAGLSIVSAETTDVWNGEAATEFAGGDGTQTNPFLIENGAQLAKAVIDKGLNNNVAAYYMITNDIYLNEDYENYLNWGTNAPKNNWGITYSSSAFTGYLDGGYHTIYGMYYSKGGSYAGLVAYLSGTGATICNLTIANSYVNNTSGNSTALFAGRLDNGTIINCIACDSYLTNKDNKTMAGIAAWSNTNTTKITNCAAYGLSFSSTNTVGGILAQSNGGNATVSKCFSGGTFIFGNTSNISCNNSYTDIDAAWKNGVTEKLDGSMQGANALTAMANLATGVWKATDSYPTLIGNGVKGEVWSGAKAAWFAGGKGTQADPFLIETGEQLYKAICDKGMYAGKAAYYLITADIYLNKDYADYLDWATTAPANNWLPTRGDFIGHLDGGLNTIYGLYSVTGSWRSGLIPYMNSGATVSDLTVANAYVRNNDSTAGIITGAMYANTKISKSMVHDAIISTGSTTAGDVGGIVGAVTTNTSTISNCGSYNLTLDVGAAKNAGGILGRVWTAPSGANGTRMYSCYSVGNYALGNTGNIWVDYSYSNIEGTKNGIALVDVANMFGTAAVDGMKYLDFINTWEAVEDGYPVLRVASSNNLSQEITASYAINDNGNAGVKYVAKVDMPAINPTYDDNIVITVDGVKKTVSETGIIISRAGIDVTDIATVENNPLTGYKVVGYTNGGDYEAGVFGGYIVVSAIVSGTADYTAKSYITFSDGTTVIGEAFTNAPSTEETTIDGIIVDDNYALGDANFDGTINVVDLVRIKKYAASGDDFAGKTALLDIVDTNGDGEFNALDLAGLRQALIAGVEETPAAAMNLVFEENFTQLP